MEELQAIVLAERPHLLKYYFLGYKIIPAAIAAAVTRDTNGSYTHANVTSRHHSETLPLTNSIFLSKSRLTAHSS